MNSHSSSVISSYQKNARKDVIENVSQEVTWLTNLKNDFIFPFFGEIARVVRIHSIFYLLLNIITTIQNISESSFLMSSLIWPKITSILRIFLYFCDLYHILFVLLMNLLLILCILFS